jgi:hypothetical protein
MKVYLVRTMTNKQIQEAFTTEQSAIDYGNSWIDHRADRADWQFNHLSSAWTHKTIRSKPPVLEIFYLIVNEY